MKLGLMIGYSGAELRLDMNLIHGVESLGFDSVWTAEAWGSDAVSPLAWIGAQTRRIRLGTGIMQMPGRSPANTAMTAMSLDALSGGRFMLGLGTSGPQVVEGWHGQPFSKPLTWIREYVTIVRQAIEREAPVEFQGERYQIPYRGPGATGAGKPLKSILHGRPDIPIYTGSLAPKGQALSAELCDGLLLTCYHPGNTTYVDENLAAGFAVEGARNTRETFDLATTVAVVMGDDVDACRGPLKMQLALYIGGFGTKKRNFYADFMRRVGFEEEADRIQDLFLAGDRGGAVAAVTDEMVDTFYLCGPADRIRGEAEKWKDSGIDTMLVGTQQLEAARVLAEVFL